MKDILLQTLIEKSSEAITVVGENGVAFYVSPTMIDMLGYSAKEICSAHFSEFLHPDDILYIQGIFAEVLLVPGKELKLLGRLRHKTGRYLWCDGKATNWLNDKVINGIVINFHDITDRKNAEDAMFQREMLLKEMGRIASIGGWELDCTTMKQVWTDETFAIHDRIPGVYDPNSTEEISRFEPVSKELIEKAFDEAITVGKPYDLELEMTTVKGNRKWVRAVCSPLLKDGKVIKLTGTLQDITERKHSEKQLLLNEYELNYAQELAKMASWRVDLSSLKLTHSKNYRKLLGIDDESFEITFEYFMSRVHPDDLQKMNLENYQLTPNSPPAVSEFRIFLPDGSIKWFLNYMVGEFNDETPVALKGTNIDITDKKNKEEEIRSQNEKLNAILYSLPDKLFIHDSDGAFLEAYTTNQDGYIVPVDMFLGKKLSDIFPEDVASLNLKYLKECLNGKELVTHEFSTDYKGSFKTFEVRVVPFMEDKVIRFVRDITKNKEYEKQIEKLNKAIEQSPIAIVITDKDANISYVSRAFEVITGYTKDEVINKNTRILKSGKNSNEFYIQMWNSILAGDIWEGELINKRKDGTFYWEHLSISPLFEDGRSITGFLAVKQDVTEKKKNEREIRELNTSLERKVEERTLELIEANLKLLSLKEAAEEANKAKSIFLANMSHEIRTPLNSIIGFSELLYNTLDDEKRRSQVASIRNSGRSLLNIINDILDLSKVEAGKIVIEHEPLNVFKIVNDVCSMFEQKASEKNLNLTIDSISDLTTPLLLDETRLRQILFNLLGNAIKFTSKGNVSVIIDHEEKGNNLVDLKICVADTGIGIPENQQKAIFEPFVQQQGQTQKMYGGTGLGLAISRRMAEAMGGEIILKSVPGEGSEFTVYLKNISKTDIIPGEKENSLEVYSNICFDGNKILIVDDIPDNRKLLLDALEPTGAILIEADNGEKAVQIALKEKPDLILMDIRMPVMDGVEACRVLKLSSITAEIPCIAVTASIKLGNSGKKIPVNFDATLMKPVAFDELFEILLKFLKHSLREGKPANLLAENLVDADTEWSDNLKSFVNTELLPVFNQVMKSHLIDDMEEFGKLLVSTGQRFENRLLLVVGGKIIEYTELFEVDKLSQTMHEFQFLLNSKLK